MTTHFSLVSFGQLANRPHGFELVSRFERATGAVFPSCESVGKWPLAWEQLLTGVDAFLRSYTRVSRPRRARASHTSGRRPRKPTAVNFLGACSPSMANHF